jgi:hypothetical protein
LFFGKAKFDIFNILKNNIIGVESSNVLWYLFFILFFMFGKGGGARVRATNLGAKGVAFALLPKF